VEVNLVAARVSCTIVDELAERDKSKKIIVIYNLSEGKGRGEGKDRGGQAVCVIIVKNCL